MTSSENGELTPDEKPRFDNWFAVVSGAIAALIGLWVVLAGHLFSGTFGLSDAAWKSLRGGGQLAARLMTPVSVLGVVLILAGAWMAVVEWRGSFKDKHDKAAAAPPRQGFGVDLPATIAAVGKLRGAALLIVVGSLLMVLSAWVAQSVDDNSDRVPRPGQVSTELPKPLPRPAPTR